MKCSAHLEKTVRTSGSAERKVAFAVTPVALIKEVCDVQLDRSSLFVELQRMNL